MLNPVFKRKRVPPRPVELLLRAAVMDDEPAWESWQTWRRETDIQTLTDISICLLPYLYKRWSARIPEDAVRGIMKGVYRKTWYKNQMLMEQGRRAAQALRAEGIQVLVLKGMAMTLQYYRDWGVRVLRDIDIHVPERDADRAIEVLKKMGFVYHWQMQGYDYVRRYAHGGEFYSENLGKIDLHWHVMHDLLSLEVDDFFRSRAYTGEIGGVAVFLPDPLGLLVNTLHHGVRALSFPDPRWILDACILLRRDGSHLDWKAFIGLAQKYPLLALGFFDTLSYLRELYDAPVPESVLKDLSAILIPEDCRRMYEGILDSSLLGGKESTRNNFLWIWRVYRIERLRKSCGKPVSQWALWKGFLPYYKCRSQSRSYFHLAFTLVRRYRQNPARVWK